MRNFGKLLAALAIVTTSLGGCATVISSCPPVVEYSRAFQSQAADEVKNLPAGSAVEQMLDDYSVMRAQARLCK